MPETLDWSRDGPLWPHHAASRFVEAAGLQWHVQRFAARAGEHSPLALLIHGTGASSHSWRLLAPLLAARFEVLAFDLPGHGFTRSAEAMAMSLPGMSAAVAGLLEARHDRPALVIGHSAGAAIGVQLCLDRHVAPAALVSINGALLPLHGFAGRVFSPLARVLAAQPLVPRFFAWRASRPTLVRRLLDSTGSRLDAEGERLYGRLVADADHAAAALQMMAAWDLQPLGQALPGLPVPLHLLAGAHDHTVRPAQSQVVQGRVPGAAFTLLPGLGHLAHEEDPAAVMAAMAEAQSAALAVCD